MKGLASACRTVQKRRKPHLKLAKGAELMMALDCMLMLKSLAQEAHAAAVEAKSSTITEEHIAAVWKTVKKKTHG
ncbi:centromere protein W isoform X2 [Petromyzon marinus]|uniref:Centromere protein W isoform X2 n=1 Tax=Petromyzon marinus TaxID=7757 RepID=A0AAJ7X055_PETMA|nr:centromere protein W isoform X2 [Petromyzon marinus]